VSGGNHGIQKYEDLGLHKDRLLDARILRLGTLLLADILDPVLGEPVSGSPRK